MDHDHGDLGDGGVHGAAAAGQHHDATMMTMYFHGGYNEVILFDFWRINSVAGLVGSMIGIMVMAVAYEAVKFSKESVFRKFVLTQPTRSIRVSSSAQTEEASVGPDGDDEEAVVSIGSADSSRRRRALAETSMWSWCHLVLTLISAVQMILAYLLMLIVMTFNSWLCLSVFMGFTLGYFFFGWRKRILQEEEHCH